MSWQTITKENNLAISVINYSDLVGRLDAEYYDPHFVALDSLINERKDVELLGELSEKIDVGFVGSMVSEYDDKGVLLLQTRNVKEFFVDVAECQRINDDFHKKLKKSQVSKNDILIARSGSFGNASVYLEDEKTNSADIIIIRSKENVSPFYLTAFLNSMYGRFQLMRFASGGVQGHINLTILEELKIVQPKKQIENTVQKLILDAYEKKTASENVYREAEQMLLKEINLEGYKGTEETISVRNFSEALADSRFDAEYWQPKYDEITKRVSKVQQEKLGDIVSVKKGVEVGSEAYAEEGKDFIRVSDFTIYGIEDVEKKISEELYEGLKENYKPNKGEVLFTKDGTIGISFALNEDVDAIMSGAFLRLKPKVKINNNYLALVLNSFYCKTQIERMSGGAIIAHLKPESAMQVKIPMLADAKQEELANKVLEALQLRKQAKVLLEKAKRAVEIFVEKDEEAALAFLD
ncbi:MAG: restriction endonuclease subunit S [Patescibacteria group bacterium]|jgi:type I restriction enzyme M protein